MELLEFPMTEQFCTRVLVGKSGPCPFRSADAGSRLDQIAVATRLFPSHHCLHSERLSVIQAVEQTKIMVVVPRV